MGAAGRHSVGLGGGGGGRGGGRGPGLGSGSAVPAAPAEQQVAAADQGRDDQQRAGDQQVPPLLGPRGRGGYGLRGCGYGYGYGLGGYGYGYGLGRGRGRRLRCRRRLRVLLGHSRSSCLVITDMTAFLDTGWTEVT